MDSDFVNVLSWYDNEWGYSNRCFDLLRLLVNGFWWRVDFNVPLKDERMSARTRHPVIVRRYHEQEQ